MVFRLKRKPSKHQVPTLFRKFVRPTAVPQARRERDQSAPHAAYESILDVGSKRIRRTYP